MSIIRVGLSETEMFATGYEAIFRGRRSSAKPAAAPKQKPSERKSRLQQKNVKAAARRSNGPGLRGSAD